MSQNPDSEDALESAVMDTLASLGYEVVNAYDEISGSRQLGRETLDEVVLVSRWNGLIPLCRCTTKIASPSSNSPMTSSSTSLRLNTLVIAA